MEGRPVRLGAGVMREVWVINVVFNDRLKKFLVKNLNLNQAWWCCYCHNLKIITLRLFNHTFPLLSHSLHQLKLLSNLQSYRINSFGRQNVFHNPTSSVHPARLHFVVRSNEIKWINRLPCLFKPKIAQNWWLYRKIKEIRIKLENKHDFGISDC